MQPLSRSDRLDIRISPAAKRLLLTAAEACHKTLSEFVLETALMEAQNTLAEKRQFFLTPEAWEEFQAALDGKPRTHARLNRLLTEPSVFD